MKRRRSASREPAGDPEADGRQPLRDAASAVKRLALSPIRLPRPHLSRRRRPRPGASPGTLISYPDAQPTRIRAVAYGAPAVEDVEVDDLAVLDDLRARHRVIWVDVVGLADTDKLRALGDRFGLHALALEDVVNGSQRVKLDRHPDHDFLVVYVSEHRTDGPVHLFVEQLNLFVGADFVLTMRDQESPVLGPVRARIDDAGSRIRRSGADYLAYALLDAVVDHYFPVLDAISDRLEALEDEVVGRPREEIVGRIQEVRREIMALRRAAWPLRDVLNEILRGDRPGPFTDFTQVYLRDCHDHVLRIIEVLESYRELASTLMDLYLSSLSTRMNEIMKVLTIIATIFIPLSFVAGLYGMNFDPAASPFNMPELKWRYGYPFALGLMAAVAGGLLLYFRVKGWIGGRRR